MSASPPSGQILLTLDDARRLKDERDEVAREYATLGQRLELLNKQVEALSLFLPSHVYERLFEDKQDDKRPRKWAPTIFKILEDAGHGLTTSEIRSRLEGTGLEFEIGPNGHALYNAISKMATKGEIIRHGMHYCLSGQSVPEGLLGPVKATQIEIDVVSVLQSKPNGLRSMEIVETILRAQMPSANGMRKSTGGFYKALSLLVAAGKVIKQGRNYLLPHKENEPSDAGTSNGSDAGSNEDDRPRALRLV